MHFNIMPQYAVLLMFFFALFFGVFLFFILCNFWWSNLDVFSKSLRILNVE
jgi:hypothetical protein